MSVGQRFRECLVSWCIVLLLLGQERSLCGPVLSDPVANACSPLCSEETNVEVQCATERGCYQPAIKANPVLFAECWKDCWYLAGQCFSLCADNFDNILGQCYGGCKPGLEVDCIAGCFDLTFTAMKNEKLNETNSPSENFTSLLRDFNLTTNNDINNLTNDIKDPPPPFPAAVVLDLPTSTPNETFREVAVLKLLGVWGDCYVFEEVPYDHSVASSGSDPDKALFSTDTKKRSQAGGERIRVLHLGDLDGFYRGADGLLRRRLEHSYDRELWKRIIAEYEERMGIQRKASQFRETEADPAENKFTDSDADVESISTVSLKSSGGTLFLVRRPIPT